MFHDLYVQNDTLLLANVFGNKCRQIYQRDPAYFYSAPGLACEECLKKTEAGLELLADINVLLIVEKDIRGKMCHTIRWYAKANNK